MREAVEFREVENVGHEADGGVGDAGGAGDGSDGLGVDDDAGGAAVGPGHEPEFVGRVDLGEVAPAGEVGDAGEARGVGGEDGGVDVPGVQELDALRAEEGGEGTDASEGVERRHLADAEIVHGAAGGLYGGEEEALAAEGGDAMDVAGGGVGEGGTGALALRAAADEVPDHREDAEGRGRHGDGASGRGRKM